MYVIDRLFGVRIQYHTKGMLRMSADNGLNLDTIALCYRTCGG